MILQQTNTWAYVSELEPGVARWLDDYLSVTAAAYVRSTDPVTGRPTMSREVVTQTVLESTEHGMIRTCRFPAGLTPVVARAAERAGYPVKTHDVRQRPVAFEDGAIPDWCRQYQRDAVSRLGLHGRGLVRAPTGSGKSEMVIAATLSIPCEWVYVVHRANLVKQMAERYRRWTGEDAGVFTEGRWRRGSSNLTVTTFQAITAAMRKRVPAVHQLFAETQGLAVDEVHTQAAGSFFGVSMAMQNAYYRLGLSGTPLLRKQGIENMRVIGAIGPIIYSIPTQRLIAEGILSRAQIRMVTFDHSLGDTPPSTWRGVYSKGVVNCAPRNQLVVDMIHKARKPCIAFVDETKHGRNIEARLQKTHRRFTFAHGKHAVGKQRAAVDQLKRGEIDILLCTNIFREGLDVPTIKSVVNAAAKGAAIGTLQRLGRGIRVAGDGDDTFEMWDVFDTSHEWLRRHSRQRQATYESEGHDVEVVYDLAQGVLF